MKAFRTWDPGQELLFPVSPRDWLPPDHLVFCVLDLIEAFDLSAIEETYQHRDARGEKGYHPAMMTALLLYGYAIGMPSSRRLERASYEDVAVRVLTGGHHPDHTRISEFRREHVRELAKLFVQMLRVCQKAGLVKLGHVALDGTKVKANASKHKAMSYGRMLKSEAELAAEVEAFVRRAERVDAEEDAKYGRDKRGDELPEELRRRDERQKKIREGRAALEAEAAAEHEAAKRRGGGDSGGSGGEGSGSKELPRHRIKTTAEGRPHPKAQHNFTDPESQIMKHQGGFIQGYNGQVAVDEANQIIVAQALTNQAPDAEHLPPMVAQIEANTGSTPTRLTADAGYWSEDNAGVCEEAGIDAYIATNRSKHGERPVIPRGRPPKGLSAKGRMERKLRTRKGRAVYARRKAVAEPPIGQIKNRGFRGLLLRGLDKARGEWALIATSHNLLKYFRLAWQPA